MTLQNIPVAKAEMLIRKSAAEVFQAFADPEIVTKFWFNKSSGPLEKDSTVVWYWELFDMSVEVKVLDIVENERIFIEWKAGEASTIEWVFTPRSENTTYVSIKDGRADILSAVVKTEAREKYLNFTDSYLTTVNMIFARTGEGVYQNLEALEGLTIAHEPGDVNAENIKLNYPDIKTIEAENTSDAIKLVSLGTADA
jgi:uncharacterized protein YndB with AHSA1/START domain